MTREEAIQVLTDIKRIRSDEIAKAVDMAISALSAEPIERISDNTIVVKYADYEDIGRIILTNGDIFCKMFYEEPEQDDDSDYDSLVPDEYKTEPSDLISRTEAVKRLTEYMGTNCLIGILNVIRDMPSASADRPSGEWQARRTSLEFVCSNCGEACWRDFNYCPSCGARMENTK